MTDSELEKVTAGKDLTNSVKADVTRVADRSILAMEAWTKTANATTEKVDSLYKSVNGFLQGK